jgi:hypothetical protein
LNDLAQKGKIHALKAEHSAGGTYKGTIVGGNIFDKDCGKNNPAFGGGFLEIKPANCP